MHIVGKILIGVIAVSAGFGFIIAARLVNTRGAWMKQLQEAKAGEDQSAQKLADARQAFEESRADLEREMLRWDRYLVVKGAFDAATNAIVISAGKTVGIQPNTELYAFQLDDKGGSTYVGSFNAADVTANESGLKATFSVRAEDVPNWNGQSFRLRTVIPSSFVSQFADLQAKLINQDELLKKQEKNLATQAELAAAAREQRDTRVAELLGGAGGAGAGGDKAAGLVTAINQADDRRNASLIQVDELRRKILEAKAHVNSLIQDNNNLAASLPGQLPREHAEAGPQK
jgi:hypothetical protein